jgi:hypothetical protein
VNIRRLAGSRRNKHLPIARTPRNGDVRDDSTRAHHSTVFWKGDAGECGAECACGLTFHDFYRFGEAVRHIERHIVRSRNGGRPGHAARAVDIATCFPPAPAGDSKKQLKAAEAGARGVSARPMRGLDRRLNYGAQNCAAGRFSGLTARQARQIVRMEFRAEYAT